MSTLSPSFSCGAKYGSYIYASASKFNALVKIDIKSGRTEYLLTFPDEEKMIKNQHCKAYVYGEELFYFPAFGKCIHIYNHVTGVVMSIELDRSSYKNEYYSILCDKSAVLIPKKPDGDILKFDFSSRLISTLINWAQLKKYISEDCFHTFLRMVGVANTIYLPIYDSNKILVIDLNTLTIEERKVKVDKLLGVFGGENELFLLSNNCSDIYKWNPSDNEIYKCKMAGGLKQNMFTFASQLGRKTIFFPSFSAPYIGCVEDCEVQVLKKLTDTTYKLMFMEPFKTEDTIWGLPYESGYLLQITEQDIILKKLRKIEMSSYEKKQILESKLKLENAVQEDEDIQLINFISLITEKNT